MTTTHGTIMTVGDIGTELVGVVYDPTTGLPRDISGATTTNFELRRPDGTAVTWAGSLTTDGTDGSVTYTTTDGDVALPGTWVYEIHIVSPGADYRSARQTQFRVKGAL